MCSGVRGALMAMRMGLAGSPAFSSPFSTAFLAVPAVLFRASFPLSAACLTSSFSDSAASLAFSVTDEPPCCVDPTPQPTHPCKTNI